MYSLNIFDRKTGAYYLTITRDTRKQCLDEASKKYDDMAWDWDYKNYIKDKNYTEKLN